MYPPTRAQFDTLLATLTAQAEEIARLKAERDTARQGVIDTHGHWELDIRQANERVIKLERDAALARTRAVLLPPSVGEKG